jgi:2-octaprenylphenol hydroxylase
MKHYDVIIIGGGMVGASLACLLAKQGIHIALVEAYLPKPYHVDDPYDLRVSAISHFSRQVLIDTGAWSLIEAMRVSPYEAMQVWDAQGQGKIRFDAAEIGETQLGHIIENRITQLGLFAALQQYQNAELIAPARLEQLHKQADNVCLRLDTGVSLCANLVVGADGAASPLRQLAKIAVQQQDYGQHGLVTVVETEKLHQHTAWQCFLATGPIAFYL